MNGEISEALKKLAAEYDRATTQKERDRLTREIARTSYSQEADRAKDLPLWAWYCRHFDRRFIVDKAYYYASCHRQGEVRDGVTAFQAWLRKEYKREGGAA